MKTLLTTLALVLTLIACGKDVFVESEYESTEPQIEFNESIDIETRSNDRIGLTYHRAKLQIVGKQLSSAAYGQGKLKVWGKGYAMINNSQVAIKITMMFSADGRLKEGRLVLDPFGDNVVFVFGRGLGSLPYVLQQLDAKMISHYDGANPELTSDIAILSLLEWDDLKILNELIDGKIVEYNCELGLIDPGVK